MTMEASKTGIPVNHHGQPVRKMSFAQRTELRRCYIASLAKWRNPVVGYFISIFLVFGIILINILLRSIWSRGELYFPGPLPVLVVFFIVVFWGVGPALLAIILSTLFFYYYFIPPIDGISVGNLLAILQLAPFVIPACAIALIAAQRERARLRTVAAEQKLQAYAQELVEANQQLEEASQMKDHFISIASHELKTPITTIRIQAQLALRRLSKQQKLSPDVDGLRTSLERIDEQTGRLTVLIEELLDVSSMRAGKTELHKQRCDIEEICHKVVDDQRLLTGRCIALDAPDVPIKLYADCDRLAQVFVNLVSNAVKYSPEGSPIEVSVSTESHHALVRVHDHGSGISKEQLPHIFETFYRTPDAQASSTTGLGLGLAICKEIVERHDGRIWCESEPGQGSTFFVELPL